MPTTRTLLVASAATAIITGVGAAYAFVTAAGGGSGAAKAVSILPIVVNAPAQFTVNFGHDTTLSGTYYNPNPFPIKITQLKVELIDFPNPCTENDFELTGISYSPSVEVPARTTTDGKLNWTGARIKIRDNTLQAQNDCLTGGSVVVRYTVNA